MGLRFAGEEESFTWCPMDEAQSGPGHSGPPAGDIELLCHSYYLLIKVLPAQWDGMGTVLRNRHSLGWVAEGPMNLGNVLGHRKAQARPSCCHDPGAGFFAVPLRASKKLGDVSWDAWELLEWSSSHWPHILGSQRWGESISSPVWLPEDRLVGTKRVPGTRPCRTRPLN